MDSRYYVFHLITKKQRNKWYNVISGRPIIDKENVNSPWKGGVSFTVFVLLHLKDYFYDHSFFWQLILQFNFPSSPLHNMHNVQYAGSKLLNMWSHEITAAIVVYRGVATLGSSRHVPTHNFHKILRKICIKWNVNIFLVFNVFSKLEIK